MTILAQQEAAQLGHYGQPVIGNHQIMPESVVGFNNPDLDFFTEPDIRQAG